jgi:hypothetical protein
MIESPSQIPRIIGLADLLDPVAERQGAGVTDGLRPKP